MICMYMYSNKSLPVCLSVNIACIAALIGMFEVKNSRDIFN